jgi:hypothetical protein
METPLAKVRLAVVALVPDPLRMMVTPLASTKVLELPAPLRPLTVATLSITPPWRVPPPRVMALLKVRVAVLPTAMVYVSEELTVMVPVAEAEELSVTSAA